MSAGRSSRAWSSAAAGHVINIGSIAGHEVYPGGNVYCATKFAVNAISQGLRMDLVARRLRVSSVDPGMVETEFSLVRYHGDKERAGQDLSGHSRRSRPTTSPMPSVFCATRPPHVNISEMIVMPTAQASATMVYRKQ